MLHLENIGILDIETGAKIYIFLTIAIILWLNLMVIWHDIIGTVATGFRPTNNGFEFLNQRAKWWEVHVVIAILIVIATCIFILLDSSDLICSIGSVDCAKLVGMYTIPGHNR